MKTIRLSGCVAARLDPKAADSKNGAGTAAPQARRSARRENEWRRTVMRVESTMCLSTHRATRGRLCLSQFYPHRKAITSTRRSVAAEAPAYGRIKRPHESIFNNAGDRDGIVGLTAKNCFQRQWNVSRLHERGRTMWLGRDPLVAFRVAPASDDRVEGES